MMLKMLHDTKSHSLSGFLSSEFSRVSSSVAQAICKAAKLSPDTRPRNLHGAAAENFYKTIQATKIMAPPSNCLSPIGEKAILHGLYKQIKGEFYTAVTRPPAVYRGNPFVIEAGLAFGKSPEQTAKVKEQNIPLAEGEDKDDDNELASVIRYANRVPLLYQQSACATFKAVLDTTWRNYGVAQSRGALPAGPMVIFVHMASVWVPFTSESKEAIADYDEIRKEIKLALQECGRRLGVFLRRRERAKGEFRRRNIFALYIEEVVDACARLKGGKLAKEKLKDQLQKIAAKRTGGEKTDEILGHDGGPEGLPHSIIVTAEGIEGDAPVVPTTEQNDVEVPQDDAVDEQEPALPTLALKKIKSASKSKVVKVNPPRGVKSTSVKQMTLVFDKRSGKTGKKHGGKKTKK
jgi:DNA topoisomerase-6 subunit B